MIELTLRHVPRSRSTRIHWLLEEISCPYRLESMASSGTVDEMLHPPHVPALRDGEHTMHETGAMTEWLCETRAPHLWRAPGAAGRVGWLDWLHFAETLLQHVARRDEPAAMVRLLSALDLLEQSLRGSDWLLSDFSGVDCQVGYSVSVAAQVQSLKDHPALTTYLSRCAARPAYQAAWGAANPRSV
ncbi:glutathione S-transferase family protein [Pararhodobacter sp. SW119]|uniref:glutathione S-transferase family protein n=1 Tax=Pararhodobacter sp. SW119 TaxID=2780075 RepID=UPI001AE02DB3|nr:glutathione S-transferase family protein [Pararhodobacter sp. SW119]